jgi:hypothetical protein
MRPTASEVQEARQFLPYANIAVYQRFSDISAIATSSGMPKSTSRPHFFGQSGRNRDRFCP